MWEVSGCWEFFLNLSATPSLAACLLRNPVRRLDSNLVSFKPIVSVFIPVYLGVLSIYSQQTLLFPRISIKLSPAGN